MLRNSPFPRNCIVCSLVLLAFGCPGQLWSAEHPTPIEQLVGERSEAMEVLSHDYIGVELSGSVEVDFGFAIGILQDNDALMKVQEAYVELLPTGERPEFEIIEQAPGHYYYINRQSQRSDVWELRRNQAPRVFEIVYYMTSRRFFGQFKALAQILVSDREQGGMDYTLKVYAYPVNDLPRFFARHLHLIDRFFKKKSHFMVDLTTRVFSHLGSREIQRKAISSAGGNGGDDL